MIPDKNQQRNQQADQNASDQVGTEQQTSYRPDWIIPDNGTSSRNNIRPGNQPNNPQETDNIPMDNDETLGIP